MSALTQHWAAASSICQHELQLHKEYQLAERPIKIIKMLARKKIDKTVEVVSQHQKLDVARYLLQVDRQTKGSFQTSEAAQSAALEIKKAFPILQVSIYDNVTKSSR